MSEKVRFWVDPICPWCWVTARWIREVRPQRGLEITWEPISLLFKNQPAPESPYFGPVEWSRNLLRVMEAVRVGEGDVAVEPYYVECGARIHHDKTREFTGADVLTAVGLPARYGASADDESLDAVIRERMDQGLALVGQDVGTPIISLIRPDGREMAMFGPVITRVPAGDDAVKLWDVFSTVTTMEGVWEIKRTRTEAPDPGARP